MFDCGSSNTEAGLNVNDVKDLLMEKVKRITIFISQGDVDHYKYLPTVFENIKKK